MNNLHYPRKIGMTSYADLCNAWKKYSNYRESQYQNLLQICRELNRAIALDLEVDGRQWKNGNTYQNYVDAGVNLNGEFELKKFQSMEAFWEGDELSIDYFISITLEKDENIYPKAAYNLPCRVSIKPEGVYVKIGSKEGVPVIELQNTDDLPLKYAPVVEEVKGQFMEVFLRATCE